MLSGVGEGWEPDGSQLVIAPTMTEAHGMDGINEKTGMLNVYEMLADPGDSLMVVNCGNGVFELHLHGGKKPELILTLEEVEAIRLGQMNWH